MKTLARLAVFVVAYFSVGGSQANAEFIDVFAQAGASIQRFDGTSWSVFADTVFLGLEHGD